MAAKRPDRLTPRRWPPGLGTPAGTGSGTAGSTPCTGGRAWSPESAPPIGEVWSVGSAPRLRPGVQPAGRFRGATGRRTGTGARFPRRLSTYSHNQAHVGREHADMAMPAELSEPRRASPPLPTRRPTEIPGRCVRETSLPGLNPAGAMRARTAVTTLHPSVRVSSLR
jgi:hypothetical protein